MKRISTRKLTVVLAACMALLLALATACISGCGSGGASESPGSANTTITLLSSSKSNDQLAQFYLALNRLTLTSQSGKTVELFAAPQKAVEFIHVDGTMEPLVTVSVPQDIYTSATVSTGYSQFTCVSRDTSSGNIASAEFATPSSPSASVNLPSPITVTGAANEPFARFADCEIGKLDGLRSQWHPLRRALSWRR